MSRRGWEARERGLDLVSREHVVHIAYAWLTFCRQPRRMISSNVFIREWRPMATAQRTEQLIRRMLDLNARKQVQQTDDTLGIACIEACVECALTCTACADDSLAEPEVKQLIKSITLCLDCA